MNRNSILYALALAVLAGVMVLLAGCGGGSASTTSPVRKSGRLQVTVKWPPYQPSASATKSFSGSRNRLIASNATSILITIHDPTAMGGVQTFTVTRTDAAHTFTLPIGSFDVDVQEYADGSSVVLAEAHTTIVINADQATLLPIAPSTDIQSLQSAVTAPSVQWGDHVQVTATPLNAAGDMVPVPPNVITFSVDNPAVAAIDPATGIVTGSAFGVANVTAVLNVNSLGSSAGNGSYPAITSNAVSVQVKVKINLSPGVATLAEQSTAGIGQSVQYANTQQFTATALGDSGGAGITWSVDEANGGTITQTGLYTAPLAPVNAPDASGAFHVRATSKTDNATYVEAGVTVVSGSLIVNAN